MRLGVLATLLATSTPAVADRARLEAAGFLGVADFDEQNGLGNATEPEQRPQTAPTFGARVTYLPVQTGGDIFLALGLEAELSFSPAWTGYGFSDDRPSYFAPVFGYRANLLLRLGGGSFQPHVLAGGGAASVASDSPLMTKETDPLFTWGVGATFDWGTGDWHMRVDGRQILAESRSGSTTSSYELLGGIGVRFGAKSAPKLRLETPPPSPPQPTIAFEPTPPIAKRDTDGDGMVDHLDACPKDAESPNGIEDTDGCPEPDADKDGIVAANDRCPDRAEDLDSFEDADGCPDDDNDKDGVADASDKCPNDPETRNGIADDDGCADQISPAYLAALASGSKVVFDPNRARITPRAKATLDKALSAMLANPRLKVLITVRPEAAGDHHAELAKKRAENLKWYLVEQGIAAGSLATMVGPVAEKKGSVVALSIAP